MSNSAGPQHKTGTRMSTEGRTPKLLKKIPKGQRSQTADGDGGFRRCKVQEGHLCLERTADSSGTNPLHCTST